MRLPFPTLFVALALPAIAVAQEAAAPPPPPSAEAASSGTVAATEEAARAPVEALHAALLSVMQRAAELDFRGRYEALEPVVNGSYDLDFMASKTLGRHWNQLDEEQRTRWISAFRRLTISTYADRFRSYDGERFETLGSDPSAGGTFLIHTLIHPATDPPVALDYRVRPRAAGYHIVDVYLKGTVSELALRRSDYSSLLKRDGFDALMSAVEAKSSAAESGRAEASP